MNGNNDLYYHKENACFKNERFVGSTFSMILLFILAILKILETRKRIEARIELVSCFSITHGNHSEV